jgi:LEA14-like dessication related protein
MNFTRTLSAILLVSVLCACAALRPAPPEVQLTGLEITDLSLSHANFLARLQLYNPNGVSLDIKGLQFTLFLNDVRVADGQTAKALTIPAEQSGEASIRLSSSLFNLYQLTRKLQGQDQIAFRIDGEVKIGGLGILSTTIPIEREGVLPLSGTLNQLRPDTR